MNILIVKLSAVGDVVHTLPALAALRKHFPQAHITWVIEEAAADLIAGHPDLDRVIISRRKAWTQTGRQGRIGNTLNEIKTFLYALRDRPYDLVIDFHGLFKSALLVGLCRGQRKLGYDSLQELSGLFYNEKIPEDLNKHAVDRYLDFPAYLGATPAKPVFFIPVAEENRNRVSTLLEKNGITGGSDPFIAINPVALWPTKLWSREKFADLASMIGEELQVPVILTGSAKEKPYIDSIEAMMRAPVVNLAGQTSLRDLACLYGRAALVVTTDSGPMHIAAAMGTPVVALFGPTAPERTGPYGDGHTVMQHPLDCSPCFQKQCDTHRCMTLIGARDVFEAVKKKLGKEWK